MKKREELIGDKIGLHREAVLRGEFDRKTERAFAKRFRITKLARQKELLIENAVLANKNTIVDEFGYGKFSVEERRKQLLGNAEAVEARLDTRKSKEQKRFDAKRAKERRVFKKSQIAGEGRFDAWVERTWEQEEEEYISLADREEAQEIRGLVKDIVQKVHDDDYRIWYEASKNADAKVESGTALAKA